MKTILKKMMTKKNNKREIILRKIIKKGVNNGKNIQKKNKK